MYVCMYVCMYVYTYIYIYIWAWRSLSMSSVCHRIPHLFIQVFLFFVLITYRLKSRVSLPQLLKC